MLEERLGQMKDKLLNSRCVASLRNACRFVRDQWQVLNRLFRKREAYRTLFFGGAHSKTLTPSAELVLRDLSKFCRTRTSMVMNQATGGVDPYAVVAANARREVYDRIMLYLFADQRDTRHVDVITKAEIE